jgi:hypothetical protein
MLDIDPFGGIDPPDKLPKQRIVDVKGRVEHEAMLRNPEKCKELGLDITFETMIYLKRWGGWLND